MIQNIFFITVFPLFYGFGPDYNIPLSIIGDNLNPMFELSAVPPEFSGGIQCRTVGH